MIFDVYGLFDPRNGELKYIGFTNNYKNRLNQHCQPSKLKINNHKNNWIKSIKKNNLLPIIQILESYDVKKDALDAEIDLIAYFKSIGCDLTNVTRGGDEGAIYTRTNAVKEKISKSAIGKSHTIETKNKISNSLLGIRRNHSLEHKQKISNSLSGRKISENLKQKMANGKQSKITLSDIEKIKNLYQSKKYTQKQLAQMFNINTGYLCRLINDKAGRYLS